MSSPTRSTISDWLDAALIQIAAESYLDTVSLGDDNDLRTAFVRGSNRPNTEETQFLRMSPTQAAYFVSRYEVIDHHPNDATGLSATLLRDRSSGRFTLAFRSTEPKEPADGGDFDRDGPDGADGQIFATGYAVAQLTSMETYWASLRSGVLAGARPIDLVGYSLGGHLAVRFTELHPGAVAKTTVFDSAGRGNLLPRSGSMFDEAVLLTEMLQYYKTVLLNPTGTTHGTLPLRQARQAQRARLVDALRSPAGTWDPFAPADPRLTGPGRQVVYTDPRHAWAMIAVRQRFRVIRFLPEPTGTSPVGRTDIPGYEKVTQIFGHALYGDLEVVANSGIHPPATPVFIEGQPWWEGTGGQLPFGRRDSGGPAPQGDYANTHSLVLIIDSLEATLAFMRVDPSLEKQDAEIILATSSSRRAWRIAGTQYVNADNAEGDSLARAVDALRWLYLAPSAGGAAFGSDGWLTPRRFRNSEFGSIALRSEVHANLALLQSVVDEKGGARILPLLPEDRLNPSTGAPPESASADFAYLRIFPEAATAGGIAYRYALTRLDPFVALGNEALFAPFNQNHELDLHDAIRNPDGGMTNRYLIERVRFLGTLLEGNVYDRPYAIHDYSTLPLTKFVDLSLDQVAFFLPRTLANEAWGRESERSRQPAAVLDKLFAQTQSSGGAVRVVGFAGTTGTTILAPSPGDDAFFGSTVNDTLFGAAGDDHLEGGRGDDHLIGGTGNDTLFGGRGNDVLAGGTGFDQYLWNSGDGYDSIIDSADLDHRAWGEIIWRGESLVGTKQLLPSTGTRIYTDARGLLYYFVGDPVTDTANLSIVEPGQEGGVLVRGFRPGDLGIALAAYTPPPLDEIYGTDGPDTLDAPSPNVVVFGLAGNDSLRLVQHGAVGRGGPGHDMLYDGPGDQVLRGEADNDVLIASSGRDVLEGSFGVDFLQGGDDDDRLDGGASDDFLAGGRGADVLLGGDGVDWIDGGSAAMVGSVGEFDDHRAIMDGYRWSLQRTTAGDFVFPGIQQDVWIEDGGDFLDGGVGDDFIFGGYGDDLAYGGSGADGIIGGPGSDAIYGDDGDDSLLGGPSPQIMNSHYAPPETDGSDYIDGGSGKDLVYGHAGHDVLIGGDGDDEIHGDFPELPIALHGGDHVSGGPGKDMLYGDGGADVLRGDDGDDVLVGDDSALAAMHHGADDLQGGAGDDLLYGLGGADTLSGGEGNDLLEGDSADTAHAHHGDDLLHGDEGADVLIGGGANDTLVGGEGDDTLVGDASNLPIVRHGHDTLDGGEGNDILVGGGGEDALLGGSGNDAVWGDEQGDPEFGSADFLEGGDGDDVLRGGGGDDMLLGGAGDDVLHGEAGNDVLDGGPGDDLLQGGPGDDVYVLRPGEGLDRIVDPAGIIGVTLGEGAALPDVSAGPSPGAASSSSSLIIGVAQGGLVVEAPLVSGRLQLSLTDGASLGATELLAWSAAPAASRIAGSALSDELVATEAGTLLGLNGDDFLAGSAGADALYGGEGNDELHGAGGNDLLVGGTGDDVYVLDRAGGSDLVRENPGAGFDVLFIADGIAPADVRLRRSGDELIVRLRDDGSTATLEDWFVPAAGGQRGVDAIDFETLVLDAAMIEAKVFLDHTLTGTDGDDNLVGDEFGEVLVGGRGDDVLRGLGGDDRYRHSLGDGNDVLVDTGGYDTLEFGPGIELHGIDVEARVRGDGQTEVVLFVAASGDRLRFGASREERIDAFVFADGTVRSFDALLLDIGGLRRNGGESDDTLQGTFGADALFGHAGDDVLHGDAGNDYVVGGLGDDELAGGANDDTYRFEPGNGQDRIVEFYGNDEYLVFGAGFTATGRRTYTLDGIVFEASGPVPSPGDEVFNVSLGTVHGGTDTLELGEGIFPDAVSLGLRLLDERRPHAIWDVDAEPEPRIGTAHAEQVAYVLDLGAGDVVEIVRPAPFVPLADIQAWTPAASDIPLERIVFSTGEVLTPLDVFTNTGGYAFMHGSAGPDRLTAANLRNGATLYGGAGDDVYVTPEQSALTVLERPGEGIDTIRFGSNVDADDLWFVFDQTRLQLLTEGGTVTLGGFTPQGTHEPLVEWFEFEDGTRLSFADLLGRRIEVPGTLWNDFLVGTSVSDRVTAGPGDDRVDGHAGADWIDGGPGDDTLLGGGDDDVLRGGPGSDRLSGGAGADVYRYAAGDGNDVILVDGSTGEADALSFDAGVAPWEVSVARSEADLVLALAPQDARITLRDWFSGVSTRVSRVTFEDGTTWEAATLAAQALQAAPGTSTAAGATAPPGATSESGSIQAGTGSGPTTVEQGALTPPPLPPTSAGTPTEVGGVTFPAPAQGIGGTPFPSEPTESPATSALPATTAIDSDTRPASHIETRAGPAGTAGVSAHTVSEGWLGERVATLESTGSSLPGRSPTDTLSGTIEDEEAGLRALAERWFAPSHHVAPPISDTSGEFIETADEHPHSVPPGSTAAEVARAWSRMHAFHVRPATEDDLVAAADQFGLGLPVDALRQGMTAEAGSRGVGLTDPSALNLRPFTGLQEGLRLLG